VTRQYYLAECGILGGWGHRPPKQIQGCGRPVEHHGQAVGWPGAPDWVIYHPECLPAEVIKRRNGDQH
jgi:hypothetical protein